VKSGLDERIQFSDLCVQGGQHALGDPGHHVVRQGHEVPGDLEIHGEHAPRGGNRQFNVPVRVRRPARPRSRASYDKCRARGKTHTQALLRLARQHINVLFAMLRDGTLYEPRTPNPEPHATWDSAVGR
jgi:hypothetical protein